MVHRIKKTINHQLLTINSRRRLLGFTIVELLVVMGIIGILASVTFFSFRNAQDKGNDSRRKQDLKALSTALVSYYTDNEAYPPPCPCSGAYEVPSDTADPWIPNLSSYIQRLPTDPKQTGTSPGGCANIKNVYCYQAASDRKSFVLWTQLENPNDQEAYGGPQSVCVLEGTEVNPNPILYNYCIKSPK